MFNYSTNMYLNTTNCPLNSGSETFLKILLVSPVNTSFKISYLLPFLIIATINILFLLSRKSFILYLQNMLTSLNFIQSTDLIPVVIFYLLFIILNGVYSIISANICQVQLLLFTFVLYGVIILLLPLTYFTIFGINTLVCLGLTQKKTYLSMFLNDCIVLISFLLRICSQYIRLGLITITFLLLYEYINSISVWVNNGINTGYNFSIVECALAAIRIIFELIDFFFIFILQINVFFVVLIWLLSFLFIIKFKNIFEL